MCRFLRNPSELKSIKNMSLLRQQMSPTRPAPALQQQQAPQHQAPVSIKVEPELEEGEPPVDEDLLPTDLSMEHPTDLSPSRHVHCSSEVSSQFSNVKVKTDSDAAQESK